MRLRFHALPERLHSRVFSSIIVGVVALASFLSFSLQPLVGKLLLPIQGGTASTWLGVMVFFQAALLLGYSWAAWLLRRRPLTQVGAVATLALTAMLGNCLSWMPAGGETGQGAALLTLGFAILPATILLFSAGPLMHGWLRGRGQPVPYPLYAFANAGGLAAVLGYPFIIERSIGLADQRFYWNGFLWVLGGLLGLTGLLFLRTAASAPHHEETRESITIRRVGAWLGLSVLVCVGMLGATHHLAAEIGSAPLAWAGPFGAFLFSFLIIFSGLWQPRFTLACLGWLAVSLTGFLLTKGVSNTTVDGGAALWLLSLTAAGSFFGNGLLHDYRPAHRFAFFYLVLAAGGVLGGLFAALGAPVLFLRPTEFLAASSILLLIGLGRLLARRDGLTMTVVVLIVMAPVLGVIWKQTAEEADGAVRIRRFRNVYGYSTLRVQEGALILSSETTTHGTQINDTPDARRHPTFYYSVSSGVGRMISETQARFPAMNLGVIGLGAGTLAAYGREGDVVDFWEIDPKAIRIAQDFFTFLSDSRATVTVIPGDGRKGLEKTQANYDLLVIDAFCGDATPSHLLTQEALSTYARRLEERHGLLLIHDSNRYSTVFPVIAATADSLGWQAISVTTEIGQPAGAGDWDPIATKYIIVCRPEQVAQIMAAFPPSEDEGRVRRTITRYDPKPSERRVVWTDDLHSLLDALDLRGYLRGR